MYGGVCYGYEGVAPVYIISPRQGVIVFIILFIFRPLNAES